VKHGSPRTRGTSVAWQTTLLTAFSPADRSKESCGTWQLPQTGGRRVFARHVHNRFCMSSSRVLGNLCTPGRYHDLLGFYQVVSFGYLGIERQTPCKSASIWKALCILMQFLLPFSDMYRLTVCPAVALLVLGYCSTCQTCQSGKYRNGCNAASSGAACRDWMATGIGQVASDIGSFLGTSHNGGPKPKNR